MTPEKKKTSGGKIDISGPERGRRLCARLGEKSAIGLIRRNRFIPVYEGVATAGPLRGKREKTPRRVSSRENHNIFVMEKESDERGSQMFLRAHSF